ncbi:hypothetical protein VCHA50O413_10074 [Vibrio chagasii]|nr:hypothetical protein VCHA36P168_10505 [Vibrio chagasii]CAH6904775.1 hypothetical protein VCHA53O466_100027 [Vibrio chagasii]CAH6924063.1 hypothetical protein VCHA50O409_10074 [Vibrio chagasii]CAH6959775.1 hypothetical protein VCHA50O402_10074 [Vibrio chagasii]CAH7006104.1 hypothetical protein VCHA52P461_130068 [Vibrio chagasii]
MQFKSKVTLTTQGLITNKSFNFAMHILITILTIIIATSIIVNNAIKETGSTGEKKSTRLKQVKVK